MLLKTLHVERLVEVLKEYGLNLENYAKKEELLELIRQRAKDILELKSMAESIVNEPTSYDEKAVKKALVEKNISIFS